MSCLCMIDTVYYHVKLGGYIQGALMTSKFIEVDRETQYLFPPSVQDWLPEGHLARLVVEIVEQCNLERLKASYAGRGSEAYSPEMLVALLFFGDATRVFFRTTLEWGKEDF